MVKFLTIVLSLFLLVGCSNSKKISQPIIISKNEQLLSSIVFKIKPTRSVDGYDNNLVEFVICKTSSDSSLPNAEGVINIHYLSYKKSATGYDVLFTIEFAGNIKEIFVDNKKVNWTRLENDYIGELTFNQTVNLNPGKNKIPVKVIGYSGDETESFIEIQTEK